MPLTSWIKRVFLKSLVSDSRRAIVHSAHRPGVEMLEERVVPASFFTALTGDDGNAGDLAHPFRTVQAAINAAAAAADGNDIVSVEAGTYNTAGVDLAINIPDSPNLSNLQLLGGFDAGAGFTTRTPRSTIFIPQQAGSINFADVAVQDANVTIDGFYFVFDGNGVGGTGGTRLSGGVLSYTTGFTLNNNAIEVGLGRVAGGARSVGVGTLASDQTGLKITNNLITANAGTGAVFNDFAHGIFINPDAVHTTDLIISGNTITGTTLANGVILDTTGHVSITDNVISRTGTGNVFNLALIDLRARASASPLSDVTISRNSLDAGNRANSVGIWLDDNGGTQDITNLVIDHNLIQNAVLGIFVGPGANQQSDISATIRYNSFTGNTTALFRTTPSTGSTTIDASRNWWGDVSGPTTATNPGGLGQAINDATGITFAPWLIYAPDSDAVTPGVQLKTTVTVAAGGDISAADNDFRRLQNAFGSAASGQTFDLSGAFNWSSAFALASYTASTSTSDTGDIRGAELADGADNVTITSSASNATVQGVGDFADGNFASFLFADDSTSNNGGANAVGNVALTIEKLVLSGFENAFAFGWNATGAFNNLIVRNNTINLAGDNFATQNIAIYFSLGTNEQFLGNQINFAGNGTKVGASSYGFQNSTTGGTGYDGLKIDNNIFQVLASANGTEVLTGIWENGDNDDNASHLAITNNQFLGRAGGPLLTRGLMLTSTTTGLMIDGNHFTDVDKVFFARNAGAGTEVGDRFKFTNNVLTRVGGTDGVILRNVTSDAITVVIDWNINNTIDGLTGVRGLNELSVGATGSPRPASGATDINSVNGIGALPTVFVDDSWAGAARFTDPDGIGAGIGPVAFGFNGFASIQAGLNAVDTAGAVRVLAGTYNESLNLSRAVSLLGAQDGVSPANGRTFAGAAESTLVAQPGSAGMNVTTSNVTISGFSVQGSATAVNGITTTIGSAAHNVFRQNIVKGFTNTLGIALGSGDHDTTIDDNDISSNYAGIYLATGANTNTVTNNVVHDQVGTGLDAGSGIVLEGNNTNNSIKFNTVRDNAGSGFYVHATGVGGDSFAGTHINGNTISGNAIAGFNNTNVNSTVIDAERNFWGDLSGPTIASNPGGTGDKILEATADTVDYKPFGLIAEVSGVLYIDTNSNSAKDPGEAVVAGRTVFLDANGNGQFDAGEPSAVTGADGSYLITAPPGTYTLRFVSVGFESPIVGDPLVLAAEDAVTVDLGLRVQSAVGQLPVDIHVFDGTFADPDTALIQGYYHALLGRAGDPASVAAWVDQLHSTSRDAVINGFLGSVEFRTLQVQSIYRSILGREGETAGVTFWVAQMGNGMSSSDVTTAFLLSEEFTNKTPSSQLFVDSLYRILLSREGDSAGAAGWVNALNSGATRTQVIDSFFQSAESRNRALDSLYAQLLQRPVDPTGQAGFLPLASNGDGYNQLIVALLSSTEFFVRRTT